MHRTHWTSYPLAALTLFLCACSTQPAEPPAPAQSVAAPSAASEPARTPVPAVITQRWVEQRLQEQLREEILPQLALAKKDDPSSVAGLQKLLPTVARRRLRTNFTEQDWTLARLEGGPKMTTFNQWLGQMMRVGQDRRFDQMELIDAPMPGFGGLPPAGLLQLAVVLRIDMGGARYEDPEPLRYDQKRDEKKVKAYKEKAAQVAKERSNLKEREAEFIGMLEGAIAGAVADPRLQGENVRLIATLIDRALAADVAVDVYYKAAERYAERPDADAWLKEYFLGAAGIEQAWQTRGADTAGNTSSAQFRAFQKRLDTAYTHLTNAQRLFPQRPNPAVHLITLTMGSENRAHETPLYWFERAIAADPCCDAAYERLRTASMERWGADERDALSYMRRLADGNRATGGATACGAFAVSFAGTMAEDDEDYFKRSGVTLLLCDALRPYFDSTDPGMDPNEARSFALAVAFKTGDHALARTLLETEWPYVPTSDKRFQINKGDVARWAYDRDPTLAPLLRALKEADAAGDAQQAAAHAKKLLDTPGLPAPIRAQASAVLEAQSAAERYAAGEEVALLGPGVPFLWILDESPYRTFRDGAFVFSEYPIPERNGSGWTMCAVPLGPRYQLTAKVRYSRGPEKLSTSLGSSIFSFNMPDRRVPAARSSLSVASVGEDTIRKLVPSGAAREGDTGPREYAVRLDIDGKRANVYVDGVLIEKVSRHGLDSSPVGNRLLIGALPNSSQLTIEITDLRVKALSEPLAD